jgi:hypothetical protein
MVKHLARIWWMDLTKNRADRLVDVSVLVGPTRIAFDLPHLPPDGNSADYVVELTFMRQPDWVGHWKRGAASGDVEVRRYDASDGGIALVGVWKQDGRTDDFLVEVDPDGVEE